MVQNRNILCCILLAAVCMVPAIGYGQAQEAEPARIVHIELGGPLLERPMEDALLMNMEGQKTLLDVVKQMKKARDDDSVKAVVITLNSPSLGLAQIEELRNAIQMIRSADKDVYVHVDELHNGSYLLLSAASHVSMVPHGDVWLIGLYGESPYLRGLLDKIGVEPEFIQMGNYKSAAETLTRTEPSPEAREMQNWLLDSIYGSMVEQIAAARNMNTDQVRELIDNGPFTAEAALEAGLIDSIKYRQDFVADLKERYGEDVKFVKDYGLDGGPDINFDNPFAFFSIFQEIMNPSKKAKKPSIGIVYVEGAIMTGKAKSSPFGGSDGAYSTTIRQALDDAAKDPSIKAVVLRVDSPGGSALASEIIWNATQRVKDRKPLIASMGNVAASGGYYVSCGSDAIFADDMTITASIGVIGGKLITTGLWDKLGVAWSENQRGENANIMNTSHPFSDTEREKITSWMEEIYGVFRSRVEAGRGGKLAKPLLEMAGGRVYTGQQALDLGLVDRIGTLDDAIKFAAARANISDFEIRTYPESKNFLQLLTEALGGQEEESDDLDARTSVDLFPAWTQAPLLQAALPVLKQVDPMRADAIINALTRLYLMQDEGVILMMPFDIVVR